MDMTSHASLVLMNDEGHYRRIMFLVGASKDVFKLENWLEDYASGLLYDQLDDLSDLASELLTAAAREIDWREIALDLWTEHHDVTASQALGLEEFAQ